MSLQGANLSAFRLPIVLQGRQLDIQSSDDQPKGGRALGAQLCRVSAPIGAVLGAAVIPRAFMFRGPMPFPVPPDISLLPACPPNTCATVLDLGGQPQLLYLSTTSALTFERVHVQGKHCRQLYQMVGLLWHCSVIKHAVHPDSHARVLCSSSMASSA